MSTSPSKMAIALATELQRAHIEGARANNVQLNEDAEAVQAMILATARLIDYDLAALLAIAERGVSGRLDHEVITAWTPGKVS